MKIKWPEKLPSDPIEAARVILTHPVEGKGLDYILSRINQVGKGALLPSLFKSCRTISLETRKIKFMQKQYGVKFVPFALVLPKKDFNALMESHYTACDGVYLEPHSGAIFPFNKIGFSMVADSGSRKTVLTAWHELRHHIYSARAVQAISVLESILLTEIFAYVVNVKADETDWIIVGNILKREAEQFFYRPPALKVGIILDITHLFDAIEKITDNLHELGSSFPQRIIDTLILRSENLQQLAFRLDRLCVRRAYK